MKFTISAFLAGLTACGLALSAGLAHADITYVDATHGTSGNTAVAPSAGGGVFNPVSPQGPGGDGLWDIRTGFANGSTIYQNAQSGNTDNAHRLVTSVSVPASTYDVFAYFWSDGPDNWRLGASFSDLAGDLPLYLTSSAGVTLASASTFTNSVLTAEGNRTLYQVALGQVTGSSISVYIDDSPNQLDQNQRTWYDGIGYSQIPEPASIGMLLLGLAGSAMARRRHA